MQASNIVSYNLIIENAPRTIQGAFSMIMEITSHKKYIMIKLLLNIRATASDLSIFNP